MKLSPELLSRSPEEAIRRLCFGLLDEAADGLARMDNPDDAESLHDFRVALRRLRSLMRAYRSALKGSGAKKLSSQVKKLASSTNVARDTEVQIEWLQREQERLDEPGASGVRYLLGVLESRQQATPSAELLIRGLSRVRRRFEKAFATISLSPREEADRSFVTHTAGVVLDHARTLEQTLERIHSAEDVELLHECRLEAKRLRYVMEPLQDGFASVRALIRKMKSLQDVLGELQDTRVMTETLSEALESSALEQARRIQEVALSEGELPEAYPPLNAGLLELLKQQRTRRDRCYTELAAVWSGPDGNPFFEETQDLTMRLGSWPAGGPPTRRFLLREVPEALRSSPAEVVHDGWLPGSAIRERVRSVRQGRATRFSRLLDAPAGAALEEKLTRPVFEQFWPLTEGRRLESRRYQLADPAGTWTVSELPAKDLVLATTTAPVDAPVPIVLEDLIVREVTGVKKYALDEIAKRRT